MIKNIKISVFVLGCTTFFLGGAIASNEDLGLGPMSPRQQLRGEISRLEALPSSRIVNANLQRLRIQLSVIESGVPSSSPTTAPTNSSTPLIATTALPLIGGSVASPSVPTTGSSVEQMKADLDTLHNSPSSRLTKAKMDRLQQQLRALGHEWSAPIPVPVEVPEVESTPVSVVRVQTIDPGDWTRSFALDSGAVFCRTSDRIFMCVGNNRIATRGVHLGRGSNTFGLIAPVDFIVDLQMTQEEFRRAVSSLGRIVCES